MIGECPRANTPGCPLMDTKRGCYSNEHHKQWPKRLYKTAVEKAFRELPENKEQKCVWEHNELHEFAFPPKKPHLVEMLAALSQVALEGEQYEQAA